MGQHSYHLENALGGKAAECRQQQERQEMEEIYEQWGLTIQLRASEMCKVALREATFSFLWAGAMVSPSPP